MTFVLINENTSQSIERRLSILGYTPIRLPKTRLIAPPLSAHPDMLIFKSGSTLFTSAEYCDEASYVFSDIREYRSDVKIIFTDEAQKREYPGDAIFNIRLCGRTAFLKKDTVSPTVREHLMNEGYRCVNVKQGYPACTTLSFADTVITADLGMIRAARGEGMETLLIENGDIALPPYDYGFIGGASAVYRSWIYFFGNLDLHKNASEIKEAIRRVGYTPVSLSDEPLVDLGGAIFI